MRGKRLEKIDLWDPLDIGKQWSGKPAMDALPQSWGGARRGGARVEGKERERSSAGILPSFLAGVVCELAGVACLSWKLG